MEQISSNVNGSANNTQDPTPQLSNDVINLFDRIAQEAKTAPKDKNLGSSYGFVDFNGSGSQSYREPSITTRQDGSITLEAGGSELTRLPNGDFVQGQPFDAKPLNQSDINWYNAYMDVDRSNEKIVFEEQK